MARKTQFQTRLDSDNAEAVEEYADGHDVSQAEAVRRLVRAGIEAVEEEANEEAGEEADTVSNEEIAQDLREIRGKVEDEDSNVHVMNAPPSRMVMAVMFGFLAGALLMWAVPV